MVWFGDGWGAQMCQCPAGARAAETPHEREQKGGGGDDTKGVAWRLWDRERLPSV